MRTATLPKATKMAVIAPAAFLNSLAIGTTSLGMLFIVKDLYGASPALVGWLGATFSAAYLTGCLTLGKVARRLRPRSAMVLTLSGSALVMALFLAWPGTAQAFIANVVYGFVMAFFWPPLMGWLSKGLEGAELNKATSLFSFSWSIGIILSSYLAGILSEAGKFLPIIVSMSLFGLDAAFVLVSGLYVSDDPPVSAHSVDTAPSVDRSTPLRYPAWLGAFLIYIVMGVIFNVFPVFARDELALGESAVGLVLMMRALASTAGFLVLSRVTLWQFKRAALPALSVLTVLVLIALTLTHTALGYALWFAAIGLLQSIMYNNSLFYATSGAPDRDHRASIHETLLTFGQVVGSIAGGIVYQGFSMTAVFFALILALFTGALAQTWMVVTPRRRPLVNRRS